MIYLPLREHTRRANNTPNNRCSPKYLRRRANKPIHLVRTTHIWNISEHPRLNSELDSPRDDSGDDLRPEHDAWGNFHVVTELEVACEGEGLVHGVVAPGLEQHHCDGFARESISDDELRDNVEADLLVRDGLDHTDRDDVDERCEETSEAERKDSSQAVPDTHG